MHREVKIVGKRSNFERVERDFYPTPYEAVVPLLPHLPGYTEFSEPCCGEGHLVRHLERHGHRCVMATDIDGGVDVFDITRCDGDMFITNPPWSRGVLHPLIEHLSGLALTWLLFDADWMHTKQSASLMTRCRKIVSVGRVKWIPDSKMTGKDNAAWYLFDGRENVRSGVSQLGTQFFGRPRE